MWTDLKVKTCTYSITPLKNVRSAALFTGDAVSSHVDLMSRAEPAVEDTFPTFRVKLRGVFFVLLTSWRLKTLWQD